MRLALPSPAGLPAVCLLVLLATNAPAPADVIFIFDYSGSTEFNDPVKGPGRRTALEDAAARLGRIFDHTTTLNISVTSSNDQSNGTLAGAYSEFGSPPGGFAGYFPGVVQKKIQTGTDDNGGSADGGVDVNFGWDWDLDDEVSATRFDFKATIIHELVHTVGFGSGILADGSDYWGTPLGDPGIWEPFDEFLSDRTGNPVINPTTFAINQSTWNTTSVGGASPIAGLFFNGPMARAANGGQPVGLFSPALWEDGSSGSHLDDDNPAQGGLLMLAATGTGRYRRSLSNIERGILEDLGFTLHPLPPPTIELASLNPGVSVTLLLSGPEDRWYIVEQSVNLASWNEITVVELLGGTASVPVALAPSDTQQYFRLRENRRPDLPGPAGHPRPPRPPLDHPPATRATPAAGKSDRNPVTRAPRLIPGSNQPRST
jgi:hypothetical protein